MQNAEHMAIIREAVELGGAFSTVEALIGLTVGTIPRYLSKGIDPESGAYHTFYQKIRQWAAKAVLEAQASLKIKSPEKWLDRMSSAKLIEQAEDTQLAITARAAEQLSGLPPGVSHQTALKALNILVIQGQSLDEAMRRGAFMVAQNSLEEATDDDDDYNPYAARANGILPDHDNRGLARRNDISKTPSSLPPDTIDGTAKPIDIPIPMEDDTNVASSRNSNGEEQDEDSDEF